MSELYGDEVAYFYMYSGVAYVPGIESSTDANGETVYTTVFYETPVKQVITEEEAIHYGMNSTGYVVYVVYNDGTEDLISAPIEETVGETNYDYVPIATTQSTPTSVSSKTVKVTSQAVSISSVNANSTFSTTVTPTEESGYTLLGVIGHDFTGTSQLTIYRMVINNGVITIGLRNIGDSDISNKTLTLALLWCATTSVSVAESE